jgi:hypothetical protein
MRRKNQGGRNMANVFTENSHSNFTWDKLGDIKTGRPHLGMEVPVAVYRVLEYSMFDVLTHEFGEGTGSGVIPQSRVQGRFGICCQYSQSAGGFGRLSWLNSARSCWI